MPNAKDKGGWGWGELTRSGSGYSWRVRIPRGKRVTLQLAAGLTQQQAEARQRALVEAKEALKAAGTDPAVIHEYLEGIAGARAKLVPALLEVVKEECGGHLVPAKGAPKAPTFREVAEQWTSGELARRFPDQVREKRSAELDAQRLAKYVYPLIGDTPIDHVALGDCERVMASLPRELSASTRRQVGQVMRRALKLSVYPLRLRESSPIPDGFLPQKRDRKALSYLYVSEDQRLLACADVPLAWRLLWGFLIREGMREGEAVALTWADVDLRRGVVRLDQNKTDDPRAWALDPAVARALRIYRDGWRADACGKDLVFLDEHGRPIDTNNLARLLRRHLAAIGLDVERPELFERSKVRIPMRVHDLRGTFVTLSLANGATESWIADRTGHRSSQMINRYKRVARTAAELDQGYVLPLDQAIPEFEVTKNRSRLGQQHANQQETSTGTANQKSSISSSSVTVSSFGSPAGASSPPPTLTISTSTSSTSTPTTPRPIARPCLNRSSSWQSRA